MVTLPSSDHELVRHCLEGSEPAFRELYYRHVDRVYRIAARILGPDVDVMDTVQEVFVEVDRSLPGFRQDAAFTTWLHRIAVNVTVSALRRRVRGRLPAAEAAAPDVDPSRRLEARDELRRLYRALEQLSPKQRVAFVLVELEGMSLDEMARATSVSLYTAAARLRRARATLAFVLDEPRIGERRVREGQR